MDVIQLRNVLVLVWCFLILQDDFCNIVEANRKRGYKRKSKGNKKGGRHQKRIPVYRQVKLLRQEIEFLENKHQLDIDLIMSDLRTSPLTHSSSSSGKNNFSQVENHILQLETKLRAVNISINSLWDGLHNEKVLRFQLSNKADQLEMDVKGTFHSVSTQIDGVKDQCTRDYGSLKTNVVDHSNEIEVLKKKIDWIMSAVTDLLKSQGLLLKDIRNVIKDMHKGEPGSDSTENEKDQKQIKPTTTTLPTTTLDDFEEYFDQKYNDFQADSSQVHTKDISNEVQEKRMKQYFSKNEDEVETKSLSSKIDALLVKLVNSTVHSAIEPLEKQMAGKDEEIRHLKEKINKLSSEIHEKKEGG